MNIADSKKRVAHEMEEFLVVFVLLAPFFVSFATFRMYVTREFGNALFVYGTALFNALVLAKIILIGELAKLGRGSEGKPLIVSTIHKSALFTLFYIAFHILEHTVRGLWHGETFLGAIHAAAATRKGELVCMALVLFFAFIPFFAVREMRRVMGEDKFRDLFTKRQPPRSDELKKHALAG
jgi:hypothetical protein